MNEELRQPPVIDLDALLQPISDESPAGESLRYSGIYDEIKEARRADDVLDRGEWVSELKTADYRKVIDLGVTALTTQSKDVQIGVWVADAAIRKYGFVGLRDGVLMLNGLLENFWDTLHPEVEDGDQEGRANAIAWLDVHGADSIKTVPFTGSQGYNLTDFEDAQKYNFPDDVDSLMPDEQEKINQLKAQAEKNRSVTAVRWAAEVAMTRRAPMEAINFAIEECWPALNELNRLCEEKFERNQTPGIRELQKALEAVHDQVKKLLEQKRIEEPDEIPVEETAGDGSSAPRTGGDGTASGAIASRQDALRRLSEIAVFFQKTEPHSPVSYLVQRAVKWGNMGLATWLQDVIKDEGVLFQLRETLGVGTGGDSGYGSSDYSGGSDYSAAPAAAEETW